MARRARSMAEFNVKEFLTKHVGDKGIDTAVKYDLLEVKMLCTEVTKVLLEEPSLLELKPPISICGNLNGQYRDLLAALCAGGYPPGVKANWLFLGDYVSRGCRGMECLCFLLALKLLHPANIFLLRGHHEDRDVAAQYGFKAEAERKLGANNAWDMFTPVFEALPLAAVIGEPPKRIFAVHGGISPMMRLTDIRDVKRPCVVPRYGLVCDLLWADVDPLTETFADSHRGISHRFGRKALSHFCTENAVALVIRGHQLVQEGFQFFGSQLVTVWTATGYNSEFNNCGAIAVVNEEGAVGFKVMVMEAGEEDEAQTTDTGRNLSATAGVPLVDAVQNCLLEEAKDRQAQGIEEPKEEEPTFTSIFKRKSRRQSSKGRKSRGSRKGSRGSKVRLGSRGSRKRAGSRGSNVRAGSKGNSSRNSNRTQREGPTSVMGKVPVSPESGQETEPKSHLAEEAKGGPPKEGKDMPKDSSDAKPSALASTH